MIVICVQTLAPTTGSGLLTNDVINLKHQGAGQKLMIGWHKDQGVSETPKSADVICEQPLNFSIFQSDAVPFCWVEDGRQEEVSLWLQMVQLLDLPWLKAIRKLDPDLSTSSSMD